MGFKNLHIRTIMFMDGHYNFSLVNSCPRVKAHIFREIMQFNYITNIALHKKHSRIHEITVNLSLLNVITINFA